MYGSEDTGIGRFFMLLVVLIFIGFSLIFAMRVFNGKVISEKVYEEVIFTGEIENVNVGDDLISRTMLEKVEVYGISNYVLGKIEGNRVMINKRIPHQVHRGTTYEVQEYEYVVELNKNIESIEKETLKYSNNDNKYIRLQITNIKPDENYISIKYEIVEIITDIEKDGAIHQLFNQLETNIKTNK